MFISEFQTGPNCADCKVKPYFFELLNEEEFNALHQGKCELHFNPKEIIYKKGSPLTHIACITDGMAKVSIENSQNKSIIVKLLRPSELLDAPGFAVDFRHHYTITAITAIRACLFDVQVLKEIIRSNSNFAYEFVKYINSSKIHLMNRFESLTQKNMPGRIAETLLYLSEDIYCTSRFQTTLNRQEIADISAMTKESAIRILKDFKVDGIIDFNLNTFQILLPEQLKNISRNG
jgi:CRP/FNR family transcriptional regulator, polysaccharide utilization system transcription regulator